MPKTPSTEHPDGPDKPGPDDIAQPAATGARAPTPNESPGRRVAERKKQYLVAPQPIAAPAFGTNAIGGPAGGLLPFSLAAFQPLSLQAVEQALHNSADVEVVRSIGAGTVQPMAAGALGGFVGGAIGGLAGGPGAGGGGTGGVVVARMTDERARALQQQAQGQLLVERDQHLHLLDPVPHRQTMVDAFPAYAGPTFTVGITVLGRDGAPLPEAEVALFGSSMPSNGVTDGRGQATLTVYADSPHAISGLYVKPRADYWSFYQRDPDISTTEPNVVVLHSLSEWPSLPGFPARGAIGWGERAMRLDQVPENFRGQGIKIAIVDSGAANGHPNLNRLHTGFDIINGKPDTWNDDVLSHGTHCAGVIAGLLAGSAPGFGIRGFAPDAEIHVCKLFPGGQISQLIEALQYCIDHQIDVVNLSLGGVGPSPALEQQIIRAKQAGVACIAAAGNSGGAVQYPAASPHVLAVTAVGKINEFPQDSYHVETINPDFDAQGFFTAKFSCFGPEVDVCAPGVGIVSSVPPGNFAAWDGTSMAAPHVTGLAALMLAHHPALQNQGRFRSAERVERLFQLIRMSARRVSLGDPTRVGYGMPDALVALGLAVAPSQAAFQSVLGSLLGGMAGTGAGLPDMGNVGQGVPAGMVPYAFGIGGGGLRPQGW